MLGMAELLHWLNYCTGCLWTGSTPVHGNANVDKPLFISLTCLHQFCSNCIKKLSSASRKPSTQPINYNAMSFVCPDEVCKVKIPLNQLRDTRKENRHKLPMEAQCCFITKEEFSAELRALKMACKFQLDNDEGAVQIQRRKMTAMNQKMQDDKQASAVIMDQLQKEIRRQKSQIAELTRQLGNMRSGRSPGSRRVHTSSRASNASSQGNMSIMSMGYVDRSATGTTFNFGSSMKPESHRNKDRSLLF